MTQMPRATASDPRADGKLAIIGRILLPSGRIERTSLTIQDGEIASLGADVPRHAKELDAGEHLILPGIIDLHGDGFEHYLSPRPHVTFPLDLVVCDTDRRLLGCGITTAFYGITVSWEPGIRSLEGVRTFMETIRSLEPRLGVSTKIHLRHEIYSTDIVDTVADWLDQGFADVFAFNEHTHSLKRKLTRGRSVEDVLARTGLSHDELSERVDRLLDREDAAWSSIDHLAEHGRRVGVPMVSHDDDSPTIRQWFHERGCGVCEFPLDAETARAALANDNDVVLGAPNVVRGKSHAGRLAATDAATDGLCSVLVSDYYYPSLFQAPFILASRGCCDFSTAWGLVSSGPAAAAGLKDRGSLMPGKRGDILIVDDRAPPFPRLMATIVGGNGAYMSSEITPAINVDAIPSY